MVNANLSFAKIVANPTSLGWSQVYSAGKLFSAISLSKSEEAQEKDYLNVLGKEILNSLEQEFFTLETKDLESIRQAVLTTSQKIPEDVIVSFVIGAAIGNVLYLFILGSGKVDIKRGQTLGTLLEAKEAAGTELKEASGFLQDQDIIILETKAFSDEISESTVLEFLEKPSIDEAAENIAPLVHEKGNPLVSSIFVSYKEGEEKETDEVIAQDSPKEEEESEEHLPKEEDATAIQTPSSVFPSTSRPRFKRPANLRGTRNLIILLIIVVIIIFAASVFFAIKKQENDKLVAQFQSIYPAAEKKYNEGESLVDLNQALAQDSFQEAKKILDGAKDTFPADSKEGQQLESLSSKVDAALKDTAKANLKEATEVKSSESFYLKTVADTKDSLAFAKDEKNVYYITDKAIFSLANGSASEKSLIENSDDWSSVGGLAVYNTSPYAIEKSDDQILKFTNTGSSYSRSGYLASGTDADLAKAVALTIDNNVYVLFSDGSVSKYFKGAEVEFSLKGLDKPLKNPTKIYSTPDFENIYILDKGNSRIVVLDKTGSFKAQYLSKVVSSAVDFEVLEADKKIYILSGGKIYKIGL